MLKQDKEPSLLICFEKDTTDEKSISDAEKDEESSFLACFE